MEGIKESIWRQEVVLPEYPALMQDEKTEVAVIGGGLAGVLTAYFLRKAGKQVMLFEADRLAGGQSGRTTAKITSQHGLFYGKYRERLGEKRLSEYARANEEAIRQYRDLVREKKILCDWLDCDSYLYAQDPREVSALEKEAECAAEFGIRASFVKTCDLPFPIAGAVRFRGQACFHPLKFLSALLPGLEAYEKSRVEDVEETDSGTSLLRISGHTVEAEQVVFACHYPFLYRPGYYFLRMHQERSYVLAVESGLPLKDLYYPAEECGLSVRPVLLPGAAGLLLSGMGHRTGENAAASYENLYLLAKQLDPECRVLCRYSAQDAVSLDEIPYIGRFSSIRKNWYVATGFKKWGMTHAMIAAKMITSFIIGEAEAEEDSVFRPDRFLPSASAESMLEEGLQVAKGLTGVTEHKAEQQRAGHQQAPEQPETTERLQKQEHHRCTHLGCRLTWNPEENSWDCPCHGSRFAEGGQVLDGPAVRPLKME